MKRALLVAVVALFVSTFAYAQDCSTFTNITESFPAFVVGEPSNFQIEFVGGQEPYKFEIFDGQLPEGLILTPSGRIVGVARAEEDVVVFIRASDAQGCLLHIAYPARSVLPES